MNANAILTHPEVNELCDPRLVALTHPNGPAAEQFRILHLRLDRIRQSRQLPVVALTSAMSGEGKSLTAANLAATAAKRGRRTVLIDCDLRRPKQAELFGIDPGPGVAAVLGGRARLEEALRIGPAGLTLLPAGEGGEDPAGLFNGPAFPQLLERLRQTHAELYLDLPPVLPFADAIAAAGVADGVVLVVRGGETRSADALEAVNQLAGATLLGCVLTGCGDTAAAYRKYYDQK